MLRTDLEKNHMEVFEPCIVLSSNVEVVREISGGGKRSAGNPATHNDNVAHV
jgi:hypothetical protein